MRVELSSWRRFEGRLGCRASSKPRISLRFEGSFLNYDHQRLVVVVYELIWIVAQRDWTCVESRVGSRPQTFQIVVWMVCEELMEAVEW